MKFLFAFFGRKPPAGDVQRTWRGPVAIQPPYPEIVEQPPPFDNVIDFVARLPREKRLRLERMRRTGALRGLAA